MMIAGIALCVYQRLRTPVYSGKMRDVLQKKTKKQFHLIGWKKKVSQWLSIKKIKSLSSQITSTFIIFMLGATS